MSTTKLTLTIHIIRKLLTEKLNPAVFKYYSKETNWPKLKLLPMTVSVFISLWTYSKMKPFAVCTECSRTLLLFPYFLQKSSFLSMQKPLQQPILVIGTMSVFSVQIIFQFSFCIGLILLTSFWFFLFQLQCLKAVTQHRKNCNVYRGANVC